MKILSTLLVLLLSVAAFAQEALPKQEKADFKLLANATKNMTAVERESWQFEVVKEGRVALLFASNGGTFNIGISQEQDYAAFRQALANWEQEKADFMSLRCEPTTDENRARWEYLSRWKSHPSYFRPPGVLWEPCNFDQKKWEAARPQLAMITAFVETNVTGQAQKVKELKPGRYVAWAERMALKKPGPRPGDKALTDGMATGIGAGILGLQPHAALMLAGVQILRGLVQNAAWEDPDTICSIVVIQE